MSETFVFVKLNHKLMPIDRGELFEDPLGERLVAADLGEVTGGGTGQKEDGEIDYIGIDVDLHGDVEAGIKLLVEVLEELGAPKGSQLEIGDDGEERIIAVGQTEGVGIYLNGTTLPDEVYQTSDINFVVAEIDRLCEGVGEFLAHWDGPAETALYVYGRSAAEIEAKIQPLLASYPLCAGARVVRVA
jgi:hypothetical protein